MHAVVLNPDLIALVLTDNVGPSGFLAASLVCKAWLATCRKDVDVLCGAARYHDAITKGTLIQLFAITSSKADDLPRSQHPLSAQGLSYYFLYRERAIEAILAEGGHAAWIERLRLRASFLNCGASRYAPVKASTIRMRSAQEERLRERAVRSAKAAEFQSRIRSTLRP